MLLGWLALWGLPGAGLADDQDVGSLSIEDLTRVKVQTASLHEESIESAPAAISVITAEDIETYGWRTFAEVLNHVRGIFVTYDYTYHEIGVAGFSLPGDWSTRVLMLLNGHPMADNIFGSASYYGEDAVVDLSLVERIEIVRGPSSALYGSNGILATINVITKRPARDNASMVHGETDTLGERHLQLAQSLNFAGNDALLISGTVFNNIGQRDLYISDLNTPASNNGNAIDMDGEKGYRFFANFTLGNWQFLAVDVSRQKIQPISWAPTIFNDRGTRATDQRGMYDALYTKEFDSRHVLRWRITYDNYRYKGDYRYPLADDQIDTNREFDAGDWVGSQVTYRFPWMKGELTTGTEARFDLRALQDVADVLPVFQQDLYVNKLDKYAAGFVQQEWSPGRRWNLNLGARYDWSQYRSSALSPRAAIVFQPNRKTSLKFLYGRGFRNPNDNELFFSDGKQYLGNPALRPEEADNVEIAAERKFGRSWDATVSAYEMRDRRVIVPITTPAGLQEFVNDGYFRGTGVGIEITGKPLRFLEINGNYQWEKALLDGGSPPNSPADIGKFRVLVPLKGKQILFSAGLLCESERATLAGAILPYVYQAEATFVWKPSSGAFELQFGSRNLTNTRYLDPVGLTSTVDTMPQPGRSFFLTLTSHAAHGAEPAKKAATN